MSSRRVIISIVKGGLGNQLFCYAAARALALRHDRELLLDPSSGFARDDYGRSFRLNRFPIAAGICPEALRLGDPKCLRHRLVRSLDRLLPESRRRYFRENPGLQLGQGSSAARVHLNGYWQNEIHFADHAAAIRRELEPPATADPELEAQLEGGPSVFVHVRRERYSPRLGAGYYNSSIRAAVAAVEGCRFEIFGDDPDWAREHLDFAGRPTRFHDGGDQDELHDFRLMTRCRHAIVANSSFSWWAAWLQTGSGSKVWTPADPGWPVVPAEGWTPVANTLER